MHHEGPLVLAIDQGTSSTKTVAVDSAGVIVARGRAPLAQSSPRPGWVEHRADDVLVSVDAAIADLGERIDLSRIVAVGISNQRESMLAWRRADGAACSPVVSWQDRRTIDLCARLLAAGYGDRVQALSGLPLDPMFSAVKAAWLIKDVDPDGRLADAGELVLGTIDSWIVRHLTGATVIEAGNASRTSLVDLATGDWSDELLAIFGIPRSVLPPIHASSGVFGHTHGRGPLPAGIPVTGVLGDSHAALFAHAGWRAGTAKATYGTGSSIMMVETDHAVASADGVCRTIAWRLDAGDPVIAAEANILSSGSTLVWLASVLGSTPEDLAAAAADDSGEVVVVPAFNGLGAPWWNPQAKAVLVGMSLGTTSAQLARAALDSIVLQVCDVVDALTAAGERPDVLVADGNASTNLALMQLQADLAGIPVAVSDIAELSALGAAHVAGLGVGLWTLADLEQMPRAYTMLTPNVAADGTALRARWRDALERSQAR